MIAVYRMKLSAQYDNVGDFCEVIQVEEMFHPHKNEYKNNYIQLTIFIVW